MDNVFIFKQNKLYAKIQDKNYYLLKNDNFILANEDINEILDVLPEGLDLELMLHTFKLKDPLELLPYLKNNIGDFYFSKNIQALNQTSMMSNLELKQDFPNVLDLKIKLTLQSLKPSKEFKPIQNLSLSGYQHKLQVSIIDKAIEENYADFILKPANDNFYNLAINEHLNVSFMQEFGFEVPFNAIVYDERLNSYHYLIKRFDRDENGKALTQISLNALMQSNDKYEGSIEQVSRFLKTRLDEKERIKFLSYIYANALLYNNDLHKKNISFIFKDNKLSLSPVYDAINIYAVKGLGKSQCALSIKGKRDKIQLSYFKQSSKLLNIDFLDLEKSLQNIQKLYLDLYPSYIEKLSSIPNLSRVKELKHLLLESYEKNKRIFKQEIQNKSQVLKSKLDPIQTMQEELSKMPRVKDLTQNFKENLQESFNMKPDENISQNENNFNPLSSKNSGQDNILNDKNTQENSNTYTLRKKR